MPTPSDFFNLTSWKITLPVDGGDSNSDADEVLNLVGYESQWFFDNADGSMTFRTPVDGATTSGSSYPRTELREMNGSARAAWTLSTGGEMVAQLEVDAAPRLSSGVYGRVVVGQIHGQDDELIRL